MRKGRAALLVLWAVVGACGPDEAPRADAPPEPEPPEISRPADGDEVAPRRGMMTYLADAPRFVECATAVSYPIAMEGGYLELERAYLAAQAGAGEPLLVTVEGRFAPRPGMEGGEVPTLVVERFGQAFPGAGCGEARVDRPLEGTEWLLWEVVEGVPVPEGSEATLLLDREEARATGSSGCARFQAAYDLVGGRLRLGTPVLTRMACPDALATLETDYLEALRVTGSFRLAGDTLELLGEDGPVARLVAR